MFLYARLGKGNDCLAGYSYLQVLENGEKLRNKKKPATSNSSLDPEN